MFLFFTPDALNFYNLMPVLEKGIFSVIKEGWKLITYPYGETIVLAIIFQRILLTLNIIMFISVLGINFASTSLFPLLQTFRIMRIGETFNRLDIFVILIMIIGGFIKVSFYMYGAMLGISQLIKLDGTKYLALPLGIVIFITSMLIASNYPQHIYIGQVLTLTYIHLPLVVIVLGLKTGTALIYMLSVLGLEKPSKLNELNVAYI